MHPAREYSVATQVREVVKKGRRQPMIDRAIDIESIPAKGLIENAILRHAGGYYAIYTNL